MAMAAALTGCVLSIDAVVPESGADLDERLLGTWTEVDGSDSAVISRIDAWTYGIEYTTDGRTGRFQARLGRLGGRMVLDVLPTPPDSAIPRPYAEAMIPAHALFTVEIAQDSLRIAALDADTLRAFIRSGRVRLAAVESDDQLVLTGATAQLRSALGTYLGRPQAWNDPGTWRRVRGNAATAVAPRPPEAPCFEAAAWREADQLFHRDPHWVGSDVASSVDLGNGRILWLFGDTWIDPTGRGTRNGARMVSNSVAVQTGTDPTTASIVFTWGRSADGRPDAFIPDRGAERFWFGTGVRVDDRLVLFMGRVQNTNVGLGFDSVGWNAFMVENPDAQPSVWRIVPLDTRENPLGLTVGFSAVRRLGDYVYAFSGPADVASTPIYAVRWRAADVRRGLLTHPEWWAGERFGWVADSSRTARRPVFEPGQSELSIHLDPVTQQFLEVQTAGFGAADVVMRAARSLTGPWSGTRMLYRPPEYYRPNVMIYAAKAHPELTGADLIVTYATNSFRFADHVSDSLLYYPRFVRLTRCR
jgi:hypothetical protein